MPTSTRILFSIHGIRTHADWQKHFGDVARRRGYYTETLDYGYCSLFKFANPWARAAYIERFYEDYGRRLAALSKPRPKKLSVQCSPPRPSIVAHSFGSYIVGYAMRKHPDVKFDKIVLCGSILPRTFDWGLLLGRNQVWQVRNDFGVTDRWARMANILVRDAGSSGAEGFTCDSPSVTQGRFDYYDHSDYFKDPHWDAYWFPFLDAPSIKLEILHGSDIADPDAFRRILDKSHEIDIQCFGAMESFPEVDIPRGLSMSWVAVNPDIYTFLTDSTRRRVVGYINAMPVTDEFFDAVMSGQVRDIDVTADHILPYASGAKLKVYLMSIATDPSARRIDQGIQQHTLDRLLHGFTEKLVALSKNKNVEVTDIAAVGWTIEGQRLCALLGMREVGPDQFNNPIFHLEIRDLLNRRSGIFSSLHKVAEVYSGQDRGGTTV